MQLVGIRELKNRLTYYVGLAKKGDRIIVTERGVPVAVLHELDSSDHLASREERLAALSRQGKIRLPLKGVRMTTVPPLTIKGRPLSETIVEDRR